MPTLAPDAGGALETVVATGYRASTTTIRTAARDGTRLAASRPAALHTSTRADVVHYPLTVPVPRVDGDAGS